MIRCSVNTDREGIIALWHEAFGDSRKEIEFFLDRKYISDNTVVCEENGEIISMLFLLDGSFHIKGVDYPSYYLYAACTSKKFRGKGIMAEMLDFSKNLARSRGMYYICLMPAEESLYDYYAKFGYKALFKRKTVTISAEDVMSIEIPDADFSDFSLKSVDRLRDEAFEKIDYFKWDKPSVEFAFEHTKMYGGNIISNNKGYCLYTVYDGELYVKENTLTPVDVIRHIKTILLSNGIIKINFVLPCNFEFFSFDFELSFNGMILPLKSTSDFTTEQINNPYLGLTLD